MLGAGTIINPIIKIVTTVVILGAVYLFFVKPALDTTKDITDSVNESISGSFDSFDDAVAMVRRAREADLSIVFGSRFLDDRTNPGLIKRVILKTAVWVTNKSTGLRLTDAHNGLRVIRRDAAERVHLKQDRMAHATEIVLQLGNTGLAWQEYPVELLYTDYSKAKGQSVLNSINILVDLVVR